MMDVMKIALEYVGTPHRNGAMVKGAGVDCCTLPVLIYKDLGMADIEVVRNYSADWFCRKDCTEIMLPYLESYFVQVEDLNPLDIISYQWGRSRYAHVALYLGNGLVIHADADNGVEIVELDCPCFQNSKGESRKTGIWRLKNESIKG